MSVGLFFGVTALNSMALWMCVCVWTLDHPRLRPSALPKQLSICDLESLEKIIPVKYVSSDVVAGHGEGGGVRITRKPLVW